MPVQQLRVCAPEAAAEWHPTRNPDRPEDLLPKANVKRWFRCGRAGHECEMLAYRRTEAAICAECARDHANAKKREARATYERSRRRLAREPMPEDEPDPGRLIVPLDTPDEDF